jgi:hypothetical protein
MKYFTLFNIPNGVFGILNVEPEIDIYTYRFVYPSGKPYSPDQCLEGPDWYLAKHYRPDLIEVPQVDYSGSALGIKDTLNEITSEDGHYAILMRDPHLFGLAWSERPFISIKQRYVEEHIAGSGPAAIPIFPPNRN